MTASLDSAATARTRQGALLELNVRWLCQALDLLDRLDDDSYGTSPAGFAPHRAGGHLRHILEFYQCFIKGLETLHIDYDARRRDEAVETSRGAASAAIRSVLQFLETSALLRHDVTLWVRLEDAEALQVQDSFMESSICRELQVLSSHTIHHFALIAMTLRLHGIELEPEFGMAPSTLRYLAWAKRGEAA
jgi:hypothetical protein